MTPTRHINYFEIAGHIAGRIQRKHNLYHLYDDLVGLAVVGLVEADATYDPRRGPTRFTHLYTVAYRYTYNEMHTLTGVRRSAARRGSVSFCGYDPIAHEQADDGAEERLQQCLDIETVKTIAERLPQRERVAIEAYLTGTRSDGVTKHGHQRRVRDAVQSLRIELRVAA